MRDNWKIIDGLFEEKSSPPTEEEIEEAPRPFDLDVTIGVKREEIVDMMKDIIMYGFLVTDGNVDSDIENMVMNDGIKSISMMDEDGVIISVTRDNVLDAIQEAIEAGTIEVFCGYANIADCDEWKLYDIATYIEIACGNME